jgi:hypothetical protein
MLYGTNASTFEAMRAVIKPTFSCRQYADDIPAAWPTRFPDARPLIFSVRPVPADVLSGALDPAIVALAASAPAGSWLAPWNEANLPGSAFIHHYGGTPAQFQAICQRFHALAAAANPGLHVGQILGTYPKSDPAWVTPGLDFYGFDGYGRTGTYTPADHFGPYIADAFSVEPGARLAITETNAWQRGLTAQELWFEQCFAVAEQYHFAAWASWWGPFGCHGATCPPFDPSAGYVPVLRQIAYEARRSATATVSAWPPTTTG